MRVLFFLFKSEGHLKQMREGPRNNIFLAILEFYFNQHLSLWNNSLISIPILRDYWLDTMRDGHKHLLIYLDFLPEPWGWFLFTVCFYGAKVIICILLEEIIR